MLMAKPKIDLENAALNRERIGAILKAFRDTLELSQRDVAREVGYMNTNFISMIENGRSAPPLGKLMELCNAIDADKGIIPIILKYLYPDAWKAILGAIYECDDIFKCKAKNIDADVEKRFLSLIADYS
jgi:transcriptional regulator with XRE-family HTH domain